MTPDQHAEIDPDVKRLIEKSEQCVHWNSTINAAEGADDVVAAANQEIDERNQLAQQITRRLRVDREKIEKAVDDGDEHAEDTYWDESQGVRSMHAHRVEKITDAVVAALSQPAPTTEGE